MYNNKTLKLTQIIVRVCYFLLAIGVIAMPFVLTHLDDKVKMFSSLGKFVMGPFYAVVPAGYVALVCIDKLLSNVKKEVVFDFTNVKLLRIISYACFYAGLVGLISTIIISFTESFYGVSLLILSAGEFFMGLILQVIKFVFEKAIAIKDENDLTI